MQNYDQHRSRGRHTMDGALRGVESDRDHRLWTGKGVRQAAEARVACNAWRDGTILIRLCN
jgi:hypothetical protein